MERLIALSQVGFAYRGTDTLALSQIDLAIEPGQLTCIVGPNGAGKSTLLRIIGGLVHATTGQVRVFGLDPTRVPRRRLARRLSFLPQSYRTAFPYRVSEVVLMGRYAHQGFTPLALESPQDIAAAEEAMNRCDVLPLAERRFDQLSGGEQRRALLAQAFCQEAELILLDEPTASLDPAHALSVFRSLQSERDRRGATCIVVSHDLNLAARAADRVILLHNGRLIADGAPLDVLQSQAAADAFALPIHVGSLPGGEPFAVPS